MEEYRFLIKKSLSMQDITCVGGQTPLHRQTDQPLSKSSKKTSQLYLYLSERGIWFMVTQTHKYMYLFANIRPIGYHRMLSKWINIHSIHTDLLNLQSTPHEIDDVSRYRCILLNYILLYVMRHMAFNRLDNNNNNNRNHWFLAHIINLALTIVANWSSAALSGRITSKILKFLFWRK